MKGVKKDSSSISTRGERFGRAKKPAAPEIMEAQYNRTHPRNIDVDSFYCQALIHRAHVVMLFEEGILTKEEGSKILRGLMEIEDESKANEALTSYMSMEAALIGKVGEVGGKMHIGRSRNDLAQTQRRMFYRDQIERLIEAVIDYRKSLLKKAEENLDTVMPGYTHWRQAQPITLSHYLMAHTDAAGRSIERLEDVYSRMNLSTLGAAALAGTGWPINRRRTVELLGFDGLLENSYDCVAAHDHVVEFASAIAIHVSNLSRLAEDLQIWSSDEFGMIDLYEAYAGTSSIMPQKKNPSSLEMVKAFAAEAIGSLVATVASVKGVAYTNIGDRVALELLTIDQAVSSTKVMAGVISTLLPMKEMMKQNVRKGFSTMTELADTMVRSHGISFRQAHDIIAETTSNLIADGKTADHITAEMIEESAVRWIGKRLRLQNESLRSAIDPMENVKRRNVTGGPSPEEVKRMIDDRWVRVESEESRHRQRLRKIAKASNKLREAERTITG